jgi:hypothetical protein
MARAARRGRVRFLDADGAELFTEDRRSTVLVWFGGDAPISRSATVEVTTRFSPAESGPIRIGFAGVGHGQVYVAIGPQDPLGTARQVRVLRKPLASLHSRWRRPSSGQILPPAATRASRALRTTAPALPVIRLLSEPVSWRTRSAAFFPALGDDLGGAEVAAEVRAVLAAAHEDGLLGASSLAAITADRPTAPSPITVTVVRSPTPALTAQWQFLAALPVSRWPRVLVVKIAAGGRSARCSSTGVSFSNLAA